MKTMIIIPTYNEIDNIEKLVSDILALEEGYHVTIIDDNSPDGTGMIANQMEAKEPRLHVIHRPKKMGLRSAYMTGFRFALQSGMDIIFEMDGDFSHNPRYLKDMLFASENADFVVGSRYLEGVRVDGWRFRRLLLSKFANIFASYIVIIPVWDFTSGFVCYHRKVLESINLDNIRSEGYAFQIEMKANAYRAGFKLKEVPIIFLGRQLGSSKLSGHIVWEAIWTVLKLRSPFIEIIKHLKFLFKDYTEFVTVTKK